MNKYIDKRILYIKCEQDKGNKHVNSSAIKPMEILKIVLYLGNVCQQRLFTSHVSEFQGPLSHVDDEFRHPNTLSL